MNIISILGKIYRKIDEMQEYGFAHSRREDENFIKQFKVPESDDERSYDQYICQKWNDSAPFKYVLANVVAGMLFLPVMFYYMVMGLKTKQEKSFDAVLTNSFIKQFLPDDYKGTVISQDFNRGSLTKKDMVYIFHIWRKYPLSTYFLFKCMCRISAYSDFIRCYTPKIIFCSAEYSFTSSILTGYCEQKDIKHINIMHGEKEYDLRDAFTRFTKFYVWDEFYINLFNSLRAEKTKYIVSPMKLPDVDIIRDDSKCVYYLQLQTRAQLIRLKKALQKSGMNYKIRPHPIYDTPITREIFGEEYIEDPHAINIWDSIANAGTIVSTYSTVLYQAYLKNAFIMIDDVSNPVLFHELAERDYIMFNKPHMLLSETITKKIDYKKEK